MSLLGAISPGIYRFRKKQRTRGVPRGLATSLWIEFEKNLEIGSLYPTKHSKFSDDLLIILEGISDGVVSLNREAKYMSINRAAAEIIRRLNRDPSAIIGQSVWKVFLK